MLLLSVALVAFVAFALVAPAPGTRQLNELQARQLDALQHSAEQILRVEARNWIDLVARLARDATVSTVAERVAAQRRYAEARKELEQHLAARVRLLPANIRPNLLIALDYRGKQILRRAPGSYEPGVDGLAGVPLVDRALRGYLADDIWSLQNRLYVVAAAPIVSRARNRYVGVLIVGRTIDDDYAKHLNALLSAEGIDLAFFVRGARVGSTSASELLSSLPRHFTAEFAAIKKSGRSAALALGRGVGRRSAVLAALPGTAAAHRAFYAVVGPAPSAVPGLAGMLSEIQWLDWKSAPWLLLAGLLLALLVVAFVLTTWSERARLRLQADAQRLLLGNIQRLESSAYGSTLRSLANAINDLADRQPRKRGGSSESRQSTAIDLPNDTAIDLPKRNEASSAYSQVASRPMPPPAASMMAGAQTLPPLQESYADDGGLELDAPTPPMMGGGALGLKPIPSDPSLPLLSPISLPGQTAPPDFSRPGRPIAPDPYATTPDVVPLGGGEIEGDGETMAEDFFSRLRRRNRSTEDEVGQTLPPFSPTATSDMPGAVQLPVGLGPGATSDAAGFRGARVPSNEQPFAAPPPGLADDGKATVMSSVPATLAQRAMETEGTFDAELQRIFSDFIALKKQCGENIANVTFERFATKLRKNRESLIERYGCREVRFQVYIKDGKAALKATPIRD
ncbi:MAG: hypothetical protein H6707_06340 [Deltaproteobacteria bacterium]|nr:hypothetical protein [Deltaproteobacteria bacterium]